MCFGEDFLKDLVVLVQCCICVQHFILWQNTSSSGPVSQGDISDFSMITLTVKVGCAD